MGTLIDLTEANMRFLAENRSIPVPEAPFALTIKAYIVTERINSVTGVLFTIAGCWVTIPCDLDHWETAGRNPSLGILEGLSKLIA